LVLAVIVATLTLSVLVIVVFNTIQGAQRLPRQIVRFFLTVGLCVFLYRGANWARWVAGGLFTLAGLGSFSGGGANDQHGRSGAAGHGPDLRSDSNNRSPRSCGAGLLRCWKDNDRLTTACSGRRGAPPLMLSVSRIERIKTDITAQSSVLGWGSTRAEYGRTFYSVRITSGRVISGKVVVEDETLPEGATVTVLAPDGSEEFERSSTDEEALLEAIDEADRGDVLAARDVLARLKSNN